MYPDLPLGGVGKVYLVGAGPGDPGLLTLRGHECLEMADVVLYDALANPALLAAAHGAEWICVGKHGRGPLWSQAQINAKLLELAHRGRTVVRLKGGDPAVFARTAEELEVLSEARIPFEVVPGITAALAAASYVGIPITHRHYASAVAFVTGQQQSAGEPAPIDWEALARFPGTLVLYMGVTTAEDWTGQLLAAGKPPTTPAAIIRRCTWSDQDVVRCQLGEVAELLKPERRIRPPIIVIVGEVAALGSDCDWFSRRPLRGCGVLVTRAIGQADELSRALREQGAEVYCQPALEIHSPRELGSLDAAIAALQTHTIAGITFSSSNGVDGFFGRWLEVVGDVRALVGVCLAAVGPATAARLGNYGLKADVIPDESAGFDAAGLIAALGSKLNDQRWIVTTTNRSSQRLANGLRGRGAVVMEALCYETLGMAELHPAVAEAIQSGRIQYATVTSAAIAEEIYRLLGENRLGVQPVSLSRAVSERLVELGWPPVAEASQHTSAALLEALYAAHAHTAQRKNAATQPEL